MPKGAGKYIQRIIMRMGTRRASALNIPILNFLFVCFLFVTQPEQAVLGEEMLATAVLFVKLDSAKNLPVSVQACF